MKQIPLPSGRVAVMRDLTWIDWVLTASASNIDTRFLLAACRTVTIDGKPLTFEIASALPMGEASLLISAIVSQIAPPQQEQQTAPAAPTLQ